MSILQNEWRLHLFGSPHLLGPAGKIPLSPQQLGLLIVVYGHGPEGLTREQTAWLLWEREADSVARHRIRQLLVEVRSRAARQLVIRTGEHLTPTALVSCDLVTCIEGIVGGSLNEAARMVAMGFGQVPTLIRKDSFDDWRLKMEARLKRQLRVEAKSRLARSMQTLNWEAAKDAAEALHSLDPLDGASVAHLIEVMGRLGHADSAERIFAGFSEAQQTSSELHPIVHEAINKVREQSSARRRVTGTQFQVTPLVGRADELIKARKAFREVREEAFPLVLITGESGIGKTRMLGQLRREAAFEGFRCLSVEAVEPECRMPLNCLLDGLRTTELSPHLTAMGAPWSAVVEDLLPAARSPEGAWSPPPVEDGLRARRLFEALAMLFESLSRERPTILFIDDVQWADETTIAALHFMRRRWKRGSFGVFATMRTDLTDSTATTTRITALGTQPPTVRVPLTELSAEDALELALHVLGPGVGTETARRICSFAGAHPLFLTELARDVLESWLRIGRPSLDDIALPLSIRQLLDARLSPLSGPARRIADLLSVGARPMRLADLALASGLDLSCAAEAVEQLRQVRLVDCHGDRTRVAHELFRNAIYQDLSAPRRILLHRALADHLHVTEGAESAGEVALHYARAGERSKASQLGWIAAVRAMRSGAVNEAGHLYQLVVDNEDHPERRAEATAACARALFLARDMTRAGPLLELGADRMREVGRVADAARLEIWRIEGMSDLAAVPLPTLLGRLTHVKREARNRSDLEAVALALDAEVRLRHRAGDIRGIQSVLAEMRHVANRGSTEAEIVACTGLALGVLFGDPEEAVTSARRAVKLSRRGSRYRQEALLRLMVVLQSRGMVQGTEFPRVVGELREASGASGNVLLNFSVENNVAVAALDTGDLEQAEVLMAQTYYLAKDAEMNLNRLIQANNTAELALAQHEFGRAAESFSRALAYAGASTPDYLIHLASAGIGLCAIECGNLGEARRREETLPATPDAWHYDPSTLLTFRARIMQRLGGCDDAIELLDQETAKLENRLVLAWLKIRGLQARLLARRDRHRGLTVARECGEVASQLGLKTRSCEFSALADRLR